MTGPRIGILAYEPDQQMDLNHSDSGLGAFVYAGTWLSTRFDLEVLSFGRSGDAPPQSCKLELVGDFLAFEIVLDGGFIFVRAQPCDSADPLELLCTFPDNSTGWQDTCRLIAACIRNQIKSLSPRPLEIGEGKNGFGDWRLKNDRRINLKLLLPLP